MTILSALLGQPKMATIESPTLPLTSTTLLDWLGSPKVHSGVTVTEHGSLGMPAVWRAVNLIASTAASLPLHVYRSDAERRRLLSTGQAAKLLADPHPDLTPLELWELAYGSLCLWGNAYFLKLYNEVGLFTELWWIAPARVKTGRSSGGEKVYVIDGDVEHPKSDRQILHIPGFGYDGVCGVSPIRVAKQAIGLGMAAEEFGARLFGSGSLASGILQTEQRIGQEQADELKALWKSGGTGLESAHDIRVLGSGTKWQQLTIPPEDAQFIESRKFQITEVARMFGIPPHMLGETEKATSWGTGIEQQNIGFVVYTLRPWLTRVEQRLTKMLRPQAVYARYSVEGLLRGDSTTRAEFYAKLHGLGVFSANDILALEDRDPIGPAGDLRFVPLNLGVLGASAVPSEPTPAKLEESPA